MAQVENLANALAFAENRGRALSVQITVAWEMLPGFDPAAWASHQTHLLKAMATWLRQRGIEPTWCWTREVSGEGAGEPWCHTHLQIHIPHRRTRRVAHELVTHLGRAFGFLHDGIKEELGTFGMWTPEMRAGNFIYLLKGIDHRDFRYLGPDATENIGQALGIKHRGAQGVVPIKRAGTTENIGKAARRAAGWSERRKLEDIRAILVPVKRAKSPKVLLGRRGLANVHLRMPGHPELRAGATGRHPLPPPRGVLLPSTVSTGTPADAGKDQA